MLCKHVLSFSVLRPSTLLTFSLTSHAYHTIALPLFYSRIVLRTQTDILVFTEILLTSDASTFFAKFVRELHITSQVSTSTADHETAFVHLIEIVEANLLADLHMFGLYLIPRLWLKEQDYNSLVSNGQLPLDLW